MAELDITNAFNDCVDRIAQGQSIEDCLRRYPQLAPTLRPMLETGLLVQRMRIQPAEVLEAQSRVRHRFEDALRAPTPRRTSTVRRTLYAMAAILLVSFISAGAIGTAAQNALPGDPLYGAKILTEGLQRSLSDTDALESTFNDRRIQEIQQLLALGRSADVAFNGVVTNQTGTNWVIASLQVMVSDDVAASSSAHTGDMVTVQAETSLTGLLTAVSIQVIEKSETPLATPTVAVSPTTVVPTIAPSPTIPVSPTVTPTKTAIIVPTVTPSPTLTQTPSLTSSATSTQTATPSPTKIPATSTTLPTIVISTSTPTECVATRPDGWVAYKIRVGDTLSALASHGTATLAQVMSVNCITDPGRIFVGETIFLQKQPTAAPTATSDSSQNSGSGGSNSGTSGSGSSNSGNGASGGASPTDDHGGGSGGSGGGGSGDGGGHT